MALKDQGCGMINCQWMQKAAVSIYYMYSIALRAILYNHIRMIYCLVSACVNQSYMCSACMIDRMYNVLNMWLTGLLLSYILICIVLVVEAIE